MSGGRNSLALTREVKDDQRGWSRGRVVPNGGETEAIRQYWIFLARLEDFDL